MLGKLEETLIRHEGLRLHPYRDTGGKLHIGVGRNLDDVGITKAEAMTMLQNDIYLAKLDAGNLEGFLALDEVRRDILVMMVFNMGIDRLLTFKKFLYAVEKQNYTLAAREMLQSAWATQVGQRAIEMSHMMEFGEYLK